MEVTLYFLHHYYSNIVTVYALSTHTSHTVQLSPTFEIELQLPAHSTHGS